MHILIAEDDVPFSKVLASGLANEHYKLQFSAVDQQVQKIAESEECDLIILDLNLPDGGGMKVLREVRKIKPHLPVLVVTSSDRVEDCVEGLDSGADDYLIKPFVLSELNARVRALLRRSSFPLDPILRHRDLEVDRMRRSVNRNGRAIDLTPKEFGLLEYLMLNAGHSVARAAIIENVWKLSANTMTNVVDVYINYLRKKVDFKTEEKLIHTVRGAGYRFGAPAHPAQQLQKF